MVHVLEVAMVVQFAMWGNSVALRIPSAYAKAIHAFAGREAEVTVQNGNLVVAPRKAPVYTLDELLSGMTSENLHGEYRANSTVGEEFG
jgi:antitoxin MazE